MIIKAKKDEPLLGFSVFDNITGYPSGDKWDDVPKRGEYVVQYGGGSLEVW